MREREVYPHAPIVLMAIEIRYPLCEPLGRKQVTEMSARVGHLLPLPSEMDEVSVIVEAGSDRPPVQRQVVGSFPRWGSRDVDTLARDATKVPGADAATPLVGVCPAGSADPRLAQVWRAEDILAAWPPL